MKDKNKSTSKQNLNNAIISSAVFITTCVLNMGAILTTYNFADLILESLTPERFAEAQSYGGNIPPVAVSDVYSMNQDQAIVLSDVLANDSDPDTSPNPNLEIVSVNSLGFGQIDFTPTSIDFLPNTGFYGEAVIQYTISDGEDISTTTITINVNGKPQAQNDTATTNFPSPVVIPVLSNDTDPDGTINQYSIQITQQPQYGTLTFDPLTADITYTPNSSFFSSNLLKKQNTITNDTFRYLVSDNQGFSSNEAVVTVSIVRLSTTPTPATPTAPQVQTSPVQPTRTLLRTGGFDY